MCLSGENGQRRPALSIKMISDLDVYRAANLLIERHRLMRSSRRDR